MSDSLKFQCNVCAAYNQCTMDALGREEASCSRCQSTVRMRAMVHHVSMAVFGKSLPIAQFPERRDIRGIGLSDWDGYASRLRERLNYTNTYYHTEPRLDITEVPNSMAGTCDFVVSTDVFEHVAPPASRAFEGAKKLLKTGGVLILTVPFMTEVDETREHFPDLFKFELKKGADGVTRLHNTRRDGGVEVFDDLCFHGGAGATLEMRVFARNALQRELEVAGFREIRFEDAPVLEYGIYWKHPWSIPIIAKA